MFLVFCSLLLSSVDVLGDGRLDVAYCTFLGFSTIYELYADVKEYNAF